MRTLDTVSLKSLPPAGGGTIRALARIGYELPDALADIIDNSVDAGATRVEVTFHRDDHAVTAVTIADDGHGMDLETLICGMQFGGRTNHAEKDLGTYGVGLKTASLSQCRSLSVISRRNGATVGGRWSAENVRQGWQCEILDGHQCTLAFDAEAFSGLAPDNGTLVIWQRLERLTVGEGSSDLDEFLQAMMARLDAHLGLTFHRFIKNGALSISLIVRHEKRSLAVPRRVRAFDPFGYAGSPLADYPLTLVTHLPEGAQLNLQCHIWPAGSEADNFLLGGRRGLEFQGFYFYRNDRLIQAGGWNDVVRNDQDPDLILARIAVDLPPGTVDVDVQKSSLQVTASLAQALRRAERDAVTLDVYLDAARAVQRASRRHASEAAHPPAVPGEGFPAEARRRASQRLAPRGPSQAINFVWEPLASDAIFELDLTTSRILLNREYRHKILGEDPASVVDAPVVKMLLFLLLQDDFERIRMSAKRREELKTANALLLDVVRGR